MLLNTDILYDALSNMYTVHRIGKNISDLTLHRPVLLNSNPNQFVNGAVILCEACNLRLFTPFSGSYQLVCCGNRSDLSAEWEKCGKAILLVEYNSIIDVFNLIQDLYNRVDEWERTLMVTENSASSLANAVYKTKLLLGNPIDIAGPDMTRIVKGTSTVSPGDLLYMPETENTPIPHDYLLPHSSGLKAYSRRKTPYSVYDSFNEHYCINLFCEQKMIGTTSINAICKPITNGEKTLFRYYAQKIQIAINKTTSKRQLGVLRFKDVIQAHLGIISLIPTQQMKLDLEWSFPSEHLDNCTAVCAMLISRKESNLLPDTYICNLIEELYPLSCAFTYGDDIAAFLPLRTEERYKEEISSRLIKLFHDAGISAGISEPVGSLEDIKKAYLSAGFALKIGIEHNRSKPLYFFADVRYQYMLLNVCKELSIEDIMPEGLKKILNLKKSEDNTDYWNTLSVLLDNEMNISLTARDLYIHRSTMIQRLNKLKTMVELDTPEDRLFLRMCIKAYELMVNPEKNK